MLIGSPETKGFLLEAVQSNLSSYVRRFGWYHGVRLYSAMKWRKGAIELDVPGLARPLAVRGGTSDREAFVQVFARADYDVPYPGRPRLIIDAGANVGYASVKFANLYPNAQILAVEPSAENCAVLERNVAAYPNIRMIRGGVWPWSERLTIDNPESKPWSFRVRPAAANEDSFEGLSVQELLASTGCSTIDILKIDIEGTEMDLFADRACDQWLARTNMLFVETHDRLRPGCEAALAAAASRHPFERSRRGENTVLVRDRLVR